ncbi:DUF2007 domain-containing protein [Pedobacter chinensis]|uniref:DUF2007 domain-containing protein n=1 Tax=Pedobacter chinensis TaxID=2282421 RepID=A0A369PU51_9SPHI|nr:DUF2007 domain-containing protein [Pedobacter chinensis]RDC54487.1 DUF2007 domain-containing protein [Pedobacter chinensis]
MNDRTLVYSTYYNPVEANIVRAKLEDAGFACFLADENVATLNPLYNQAIGGVKLIVFERDVESINALLTENIELAADSSNMDLPDNAEIVNDLVICTSCGAKDAGYGMATKHKHSWWVIAISFLLGGVYPFKGNKCYHCYNCGFEFE